MKGAYTQDFETIIGGEWNWDESGNSLSGLFTNMAELTKFQAFCERYAIRRIIDKTAQGGFHMTLVGSPSGAFEAMKRDYVAFDPSAGELRTALLSLSSMQVDDLPIYPAENIVAMEMEKTFRGSWSSPDGGKTHVGEYGRSSGIALHHYFEQQKLPHVFNRGIQHATIMTEADPAKLKKYAESKRLSGLDPLVFRAPEFAEDLEANLGGFWHSLNDGDVHTGQYGNVKEGHRIERYLKHCGITLQSQLDENGLFLLVTEKPHALLTFAHQYARPQATIDAASAERTGRVEIPDQAPGQSDLDYFKECRRIQGMTDEQYREGLLNPDMHVMSERVALSAFLQTLNVTPAECSWEFDPGMGFFRVAVPKQEVDTTRISLAKATLKTVNRPTEWGEEFATTPAELTQHPKYLAFREAYDARSFAQSQAGVYI